MPKKLAGLVLLAGLALLAMSCARGVTRTTSYRASDGSLVYVGEAYNNGSSDLDNATIEATFRDAAGNVIRTETTTPCRVMAKNTASVFELRLPPGTAEPARVDWKLLGDDVPSVYLAPGLSAQVHTTIRGTDWTYLFGELRNESANTYHTGYLCVGWKNAAGNIVRMGQGSTASLRLGPGLAVPFAVQADLPAETLEPIFYLDAGVTPPDRPAPQFVDLPMSAFQHASTFDSFPLDGVFLTLGIGEVRNTTSSVLLPSVIAVTRDGTGKVLSANSGDGLCNVAAPPNGFTIGEWGLWHASSSHPAPTLAIEAVKMRADQRVVLSTTNVVKGAVSGAEIKISGKVKNSSSKTMDVVHVCAIAYASNGNVIGAFGDVLFPEGGLAPNATVNFSIQVPAVGTTASVKAIADGVPQ